MVEGTSLISQQAVQGYISSSAILMIAIFFCLLFGAFIIFAIWWTSFKGYATIKVLTGSKPVLRFDRFKIKKVNHVEKLILRGGLIHLPPPPPDALQVTASGKMVVDFYENNGTFSYAIDSTTKKELNKSKHPIVEEKNYKHSMFGLKKTWFESKKELNQGKSFVYAIDPIATDQEKYQAALKAFSTSERAALVSELDEAKKWKKESFWDEHGSKIIGGIAIIGILVVLAFIIIQFNEYDIERQRVALDRDKISLERDKASADIARAYVFLKTGELPPQTIEAR